VSLQSICKIKHKKWWFIGIIILVVVGIFYFNSEEKSTSIIKSNIFGLIQAQQQLSNPVLKIYELYGSWVVYDTTGNLSTYIFNSTDKKTDIGWYDKDGIDIDTSDKFLRYCNGSLIKDDENKDIKLKYETNKVPCFDMGEPDDMCDGYFIRLTDAKAININDCVSLNPTAIYQNQSLVQFTEGNLQVNNTLRKWNGEEFIIAPDDVWISQIENNFKFGANDTIATEDTLYQYEWISNKPISYSPEGYYFFEEYWTGSSLFVDSYSRRKLDVSDICSLWNGTGEPNCTFILKDNNTRLLLNFTGFYNETFGGIFIDPSYTYSNFSSESTLNFNTRGEEKLSHLELNDDDIIAYLPFDANNSNNGVYDYSNQDNDGTVINSTYTKTNCKIGGCFSFDGIDDTIDIPTSPFSSVSANEITISAWVYAGPNNNDGVVDIIADSASGNPFTNKGLWLGLDDRGGDNPTNGIKFVVDTVTNYEAYEVSNVITYTGMYHIVAMYSDDEIKVYLNGSLLSGSLDFNGAGNFVPGVSDFHIGSTNINTANFNGTIDDFMLFNRSLTSGEISAIYNGTYQKFYTQGNQSMRINVSLVSDNRVNITIEGKELNDSYIGKARIYEANLSDYSNPTSSYLHDDDNLIFNMHLDNWSSYGENDTHVYDYSEEGNNGTWNGSATGGFGVIDGKFGGAFDFDGLDDYVTIQDNPLLRWNKTTVNRSISLWYYAKGSNTGYQSIFAKSGSTSSAAIDYGILTNNNNLYFSTGSSADACAWMDDVPEPARNQWHHVVGVLVPNVSNGSIGDKYLYVDGVLRHSCSYASKATSIYMLNIGAIASPSATSAWYFNGSVDEISLWNRTLTADEIKSLYVTGSTNHKNNGAGINWTESENGSIQLSTLNSTHFRASGFVIHNDSDYLMPEIEFNSTNGYYSSLVEDLQIDTYNVSDEVTAPSIDLELIYPTTNISVEQNTFFNITVNLTCRDANCGEINISLDPSSPTITLDGSFLNLTNPYSTDDIHGIELSSDGNLLYLMAMDDDTITILNITNKSKPVGISTYTDSSGEGSIDMGAWIGLLENTLFGMSNADNTIVAINVTNKSNPVHLSTETNSTFWGYLNYGIDFIGSNHVFIYKNIGSDGIVTILNITNLSNIEILPNYFNFSGLNSGILDVEVVGNYAYTSLYQINNITVFNLTNLSEITISDQYNVQDVRGLDYYGDELYCTSYNSDTFTILNISNPDNLTILATFTNTSSLNGARDVEHEGDYVYIDSALADSHTVLDISNLSDISQVAYYNASGYADTNDIEIYNQSSSLSYVFSSSNDDNLSILKVDFGEVSKSGLISTTIGDTPFYTNESNPRNITLNKDESQLVTFWVNATGSTGINHTFFVYTNQTSNETISNITGEWLVEITTIEDTIPPNVTINQPLNQSYTTTTINFNVTSLDDYGMSDCYYSLDSGTNNFTMANLSTSPTYWTATNTTMSQGSHTVVFYCNDTSDNLNNSESVEFYIDSIAPTFDDIYNVTIYQNQSVNADFNASDNLNFDTWSSNNTVEFAIDSTGQLTNITALLSQRYYINLTINDSLNNINSTIIYVNISDIVPDTTPPDITIIYPTNATNTSNTGININYTTSDINLESCWYTNDSNDNVSLASCGTNITGITWSEGLHNITVWANDTTGNENNSDVSFFVDSIAPTFDNLQNHTQEANLSFSFDLNATDTGIGVYNFSLNDTTNFNITSSGIIKNVTALSGVSIYWLKVNVSDSLNTQESEFYINITAVTVVAPSCRNFTIRNLSSGNVLFNIDCNGNIEIEGTLGIVKDLTITGALDSSNEISTLGDIYLEGQLYNNGGFSVSPDGNLTLDGTINTTGLPKEPTTATAMYVCLESDGHMFLNETGCRT